MHPPSPGHPKSNRPLNYFNFNQLSDKEIEGKKEGEGVAGAGASAVVVVVVVAAAAMVVAASSGTLSHRKASANFLRIIDSNGPLIWARMYFFLVTVGFESRALLLRWFFYHGYITIRD